VAKFISTLTAGVAIGLVAVALGSTTELLIWHKKYRLDIIFRAYGEHGMLLALAFHLVWVTTLVLIAAALVRGWRYQDAAPHCRRRLELCCLRLSSDFSRVICPGGI
jgi:hypothetical protein